MEIINSASYSNEANIQNDENAKSFTLAASELNENNVNKEVRSNKFLSDTLSEKYMLENPNLGILALNELHETVILASFHRSGSTLVRELLEGITNIATGSDDFHFKNKTDTKLDFFASWRTDQSIWVYKTHFPARKGKNIFEFDKIILIVRNPFDTLESLFNLYLTNSHTKSIKKEEYDNIYIEWEGLVREEIEMWNYFLNFWFDYENKCPFYIVKYETVLNDTKNEMINILQFLLGYKITKNSFVDNHIDRYLNNRKIKYKPRRGTILHSLSNYKDEQVELIFNTCKDMLVRLEYDELLKDVIDKYNFTKEIENIKNENLNLMAKSSISKINKIYINNLKKEEYEYDYFKIPDRKGQPMLLDSNVNLFRSYELVNTHSRSIHLMKEVSTLVELEVTEEKKDHNGLDLKDCKDINDNSFFNKLDKLDKI